VRAGDERLGGKRVVGVKLDAVCAAGNGVEIARDDGDVGLGLVLEDAQLRVPVRVVGNVTVEVVRLDVEQHRHAGPQAVHVLQLKARELTDDPGLLVERAVEARQRPADVPGNGDGLARSAEHGAEELARRRLPVRSRNPDEGVAEQAKAELDLAPDRDPTRTRGGCQR